MVFLNKIYTRSGDAGETGIGDGTRVSKLDLRVVSGGSVDETNSFIGLAAATSENPELKSILARLQQWLFDLGADVSCPWNPQAESDRCPRISQSHVTWLEDQIDVFNESLTELESFVLPGGSITAAHLHIARSVCRRAELDVIRLNKVEDINPCAQIFLNRLSDLLFVLTRVANDNGQTDVLWTPGL